MKFTSWIKHLIPRTVNFFEFFQQHCDLTILACRELVDLTEPGANISARSVRIAELEYQTDAITHRCMKALQRTFITPFDRSHIQDLIKAQDDIIDAIDEASARIVLYEISEIKSETKAIAQTLLSAAETIGHGIRELQQTSNELGVKRVCVAIHGYEGECDRLVRNAIEKLFKETKDPIVIMKWKEIFDHLEEAADRCEDVADIMQAIMIEGS